MKLNLFKIFCLAVLVIQIFFDITLAQTEQTTFSTVAESNLSNNTSPEEHTTAKTSHKHDEHSISLEVQNTNLDNTSSSKDNLETRLISSESTDEESKNDILNAQEETVTLTTSRSVLIERIVVSTEVPLILDREILTREDLDEDVVKEVDNLDDMSKILGEDLFTSGRDQDISPSMEEIFDQNEDLLLNSDKQKSGNKLGIIDEWIKEIEDGVTVEVPEVSVYTSEDGEGLKLEETKKQHVVVDEDLIIEDEMLKTTPVEENLADSDKNSPEESKNITPPTEDLISNKEEVEDLKLPSPSGFDVKLTSNTTEENIKISTSSDKNSLEIININEEIDDNENLGKLEGEIKSEIQEDDDGLQYFEELINDFEDTTEEFSNEGSKDILPDETVPDISRQVNFATTEIQIKDANITESTLSKTNLGFNNSIVDESEDKRSNIVDQTNTQEFHHQTILAATTRKSSELNSATSEVLEDKPTRSSIDYNSPQEDLQQSTKNNNSSNPNKEFTNKFEDRKDVDYGNSEELLQSSENLAKDFNSLILNDDDMSSEDPVIVADESTMSHRFLTSRALEDVITRAINSEIEEDVANPSLEDYENDVLDDVSVQENSKRLLSLLQADAVNDLSYDSTDTIEDNQRTKRSNIIHRTLYFSDDLTSYLKVNFSMTLTINNMDFFIPTDVQIQANNSESTVFMQLTWRSNCTSTNTLILKLDKGEDTLQIDGLFLDLHLTTLDGTVEHLQFERNWMNIVEWTRGEFEIKLGNLGNVLRIGYLDLVLNENDQVNGVDSATFAETILTSGTTLLVIAVTFGSIFMICAFGYLFYLRCSKRNVFKINLP